MPGGGGRIVTAIIAVNTEVKDLSIIHAQYPGVIEISTCDDETDYGFADRVW